MIKKIGHFLYKRKKLKIQHRLWDKIEKDWNILDDDYTVDIPYQDAHYFRELFHKDRERDKITTPFCDCYYRLV